MDITLSVSQSHNSNQISSQTIMATLFEVEELSCGIVSDTKTLHTNIVTFQKQLKNIFDSDKYSQILSQADSVGAKMDTCMNFNFAGNAKYHKISIPLTLFLIYTESQLEDICNHLFITLYEKWLEFYKEADNIIDNN